jgi:hypothetical protein
MDFGNCYDGQSRSQQILISELLWCEKQELGHAYGIAVSIETVRCYFKSLLNMSRESREPVDSGRVRHADLIHTC